jgi:lactate 2-monooxygenase
MGRLPLLFDSGVHSGADIAKAVALGATAVGVGRPYVYTLVAGGADGVVSQLHALLAELDLLMAVDGYPSIADLRAALNALTRVRFAYARSQQSRGGHHEST